jgi:hypothetical protein
MLRRILLALSRRPRVGQWLVGTPRSRSVVRRFVAGATREEAVPAATSLVRRGLYVTLNHLGEFGTRRIAERPANLLFLLRAVLTHPRQDRQTVPT